MEAYVKPSVAQKKEAKDSVFIPFALSGSMRLLIGGHDEHAAQPLTQRKPVE